MSKETDAGEVLEMSIDHRPCDCDYCRLVFSVLRETRAAALEFCDAWAKSGDIAGAVIRARAALAEGGGE